jgi:hypothetical protein
MARFTRRSVLARLLPADEAETPPKLAAPLVALVGRWAGEVRDRAQP